MLDFEVNEQGCEVPLGLFRFGKDQRFPSPPAHPDYEYEVVDWKTGGAQHDDPRQLAIYRRAWSVVSRVPEEEIRMGFVHLDSGTTNWVDHPPFAEAVWLPLDS